MLRSGSTLPRVGATRKKKKFHSRVIFLLEEFIIHLKVGGSQTNFQQFHEGFNLQNGLFCQCVIVVEFISDDL
jgi:hypothetical protein